jgi:hypothetical protein
MGDGHSDDTGEPEFVRRGHCSFPHAFRCAIDPDREPIPSPQARLSNVPDSKPQTSRRAAKPLRHKSRWIQIVRYAFMERYASLSPTRRL